LRFHASISREADNVQKDVFAPSSFGLHSVRIRHRTLYGEPYLGRNSFFIARRGSPFDEVREPQHGDSRINSGSTTSLSPQLVRTVNRCGVRSHTIAITTIHSHHASHHHRRIERDRGGAGARVGAAGVGYRASRSSR